VADHTKDASFQKQQGRKSQPLVPGVLGPYESLFLAEYWQKKPLLIRGAFPGGIQAVDPDSLAGLSCQEGIDSRLVLEHGQYPWQTLQGPFEDDVFTRLPKTHWTLLVQAVDRLLPEVSAVRESFRFIPNWRLDDIMISYAVDQGSVGPHTDHYDVFLIQAMGKRRWQYGAAALSEPKFIDGLDMKILESFEAAHDFVLEPGDMLYLPPQLAHHGVAVGECMTYSIGFRAPTQNELLVSYSQFLLQSENHEIFYKDDPKAPRSTAATLSDPDLIHDGELERLRQLMIASLQDDRVFRRWVGAFLTEPRNFHELSEEQATAVELRKILGRDKVLVKVEGGRFAYHSLGAELFFAVEGESLVLDVGLLGLVQMLCAEEAYRTEEILRYSACAGFDELLVHLWNQGFIRRRYEGDA